MSTRFRPGAAGSMVLLGAALALAVACQDRPNMPTALREEVDDAEGAAALSVEDVRAGIAVLEDPVFRALVEGIGDPGMRRSLRGAVTALAARLEGGDPTAARSALDAAVARAEAYAAWPDLSADDRLALGVLDLTLGSVAKRVRGPAPGGTGEPTGSDAQ